MKPRPPHDSDFDSALAAESSRYSRWGILRRRLRFQWLGGVWQLVLLLNRWGKRILDLLLSLLLLTILSPVILVVCTLQIVQGKRWLMLDERLGRWGVRFQQLEFSVDGPHKGVLGALGYRHLGRLINVLRGDMSFIGPKPSRPDDLDLHQRAFQKRSSVRPGIVSLWWLRKRANIDFSSEIEMDLEYIDRQSVRGDVGIALRALPAMLYGSGASTAPDRVDILGIPISNITMDEALEYILDSARGSRPRQLCFMNTDCANIAQRRPEYAARLQAADAVLADGIGIRIAGKLIRAEIRQNVNGTDLFPLLCQRLQGSELGIYLLGAKPGVPEAVRDWVSSHYPAARVCGYRNGYFTPEEESDVLRAIRDSGAQILLVAFGAPKQDLWIGEHLAETGALIAMGVGGLFDFYSGRVPRAPQWMRELSLEWAFRLMQEPSRMWKRYLLGNAVFLVRVIWWSMRRGSGAQSEFEGKL